MEPRHDNRTAGDVAARARRVADAEVVREGIGRYGEIRASVIREAEGPAVEATEQ